MSLKSKTGDDALITSLPKEMKTKFILVSIGSLLSGSSKILTLHNRNEQKMKIDRRSTVWRIVQRLLDFSSPCENALIFLRTAIINYEYNGLFSLYTFLNEIRIKTSSKIMEIFSNYDLKIESFPQGDMKSGKRYATH